MEIRANDPNRSTWVKVPPGSDFPIQNLPFGIYRSENGRLLGGIAIGEKILNLAELQARGYLDSLDMKEGIFEEGTLNSFIGLGKSKTRAVRNRISDLLESENAELRDREYVWDLFVSQKEVSMQMPVFIRDYTDFYSSEQHAYNVGCMFRDPENALFPNWKNLPVGYHGRASSIVVSGTPIHRPKGQTKADDADRPVFGPCRLLDFELEMAFVTCKENPLGGSITTSEAEDHIFGFVLFNDWSARDMQKWEYVPLGPFLAKNFASSISPWIVTMDALEPFRVSGQHQDPPVLSYLEFNGNKNFDVTLQVGIQPEMGDEHIVTNSNFKHLYWNVNQQLAHHASNGCNIGICDLYASGTISGPTPDSYGSMLELSWRGTKPVALGKNDERRFIQDGDTVTMRGHAEKAGVRIGFGEVATKILPAH